MRDVYLISCSSKKLTKRSEAQDLYSSPLFKLSLAYALSHKPSEIFVLSAKYGLVELTKKLDPYNQTLNRASSKIIEDWSSRVAKDLRKRFDLEKTNFIFLAGKNYFRLILPELPHFLLPLKGLGIGKRLKFLKEATNAK